MLLNLPLPKKVYKFMKPEFLQSLEREKNFRINHLNNYPEEKLGQEIGDDSEGTSNLKFEIGNYTFNNGRKVNGSFENAFNKMQNGIKIGDNTSNVTLKNVSIKQKIVDRNYYVFCTCLEYDSKVKQEFGGATLVIEDFHQFLYAINNKMIKKGVQPYSFGKCKYVSNRENVFNEFDKDFMLDTPFLIKEMRYSYQKEFRVLWRNKDNEEILEPIWIKCPEALNYCTFEY